MYKILELIMGQIWIIYIVILINIRRWLKNLGLFKTHFNNVVHLDFWTWRTTCNSIDYNCTVNIFNPKIVWNLKPKLYINFFEHQYIFTP